MKVLLLTQVLPYPPDSGPKVKTWNVLKYLAERHEVTLVSFARGDQSADVAQLRRYCAGVHTVQMRRGLLRDGVAMVGSLLTGQPWMMVRDVRAEMRRLVDRLVAESSFDVVHADQLNMAQYALRAPEAYRVLDAHNALWLLYKRLAATMSQGPKRWLLARDWRLLKRYEGGVVRSFDAVMAVTGEDRDALLEATGADREVAVIPIAVDTDQVRPVPHGPEANHILHVGTMYWPPNIDAVTWFIDEIYPLIRRQRPDVVLDVVGSRPPGDLLALGESDTGINITGYVADLEPYLAQAAAFIVPLRAGSGMRVKILNALAQGLPIVSTSVGREGIAVTDGQDILIGDTPADFAAAVLRLLDSPDLRAQLAVNGRRLAESHYDYRRACEPIDEVYSQAIAGKQSSVRLGR
jgi:glycosyltransferase involved in cell wall biosynthesis